MKKVLVGLVMVLGTLVSNAQIPNKINYLIKSFGFDAGVATSASSSEFLTLAMGGGFIEFEKFGIEYHNSISITKDLDATNYINGNTNEYMAGGVSRSVGIFYKLKKQDVGFYVGGGASFDEIIGVKNITTITPTIINAPVYGKTYIPIYKNITTVTPNIIDETKIYPYITFGYIAKLNDFYTLKTGVILSNISSINIGFGFNL